MKIICLRLLGVLVFVLSFSINLNPATPKLCSYEPDSDKLNPLCIKGYITIAQEEGDTAVIYEQLPVRMADKIACGMWVRSGFPEGDRCTASKTGQGISIHIAGVTTIPNR